MDILAILFNWALAFISLFLPQHYIHNVVILFKTLPRDLKILYLTFNVVLRNYFYKKTNANGISRFQKIARRHPNKPCFLFQDQVWTFKEVDEFSNKIAHVFHQSGFKKGDVVALVMTNQPEYACVWLGLAKLGVVTALINSNLTSEPLCHCIKVALCKAVIFSDDLSTVVLAVKSQLPTDMKYFQLGESDPSEGITNLKLSMQNAPTESVPLVEGVQYNDHFVYIYTSGTTGFPKAAIIPHSRFILIQFLCEEVLGLTSDDIVYDPLPLYHSAGGLLGVSAAFLTGATVVLRTKFSATHYISDCAHYKCTVAQYIGEMCRYVLAVPEQPTDKQHRLRLIAGIGLRPAIWREFVKRFNIPKVMEMYGSTEGNLQFVNYDNKIGAVGSIPRFFPFKRYIGAIIRVNPETMEPIRDKDGLCIECEIDEPGMFVGIIPNKDSVKDFHGYLDKTESSKKYIYDVFTKGDKAFVSGDLIMMDELGYLYFKDRTGDTFRWKGENVSTSEVEAIISSKIGLKDCIVFGVEVGDLEGRAGMAAIVEPSGTLDFEGLASSLKTSLPSYAHPLFIRLISEVEMTGTYKLKKTALVKDGFNPFVIKDPLYFRKGSTYVPLTKEIYEQIISEKIRV
ncbi:long-chain fatty acid transport protein 4 [Halyomorpha halys]|uniref:long-chain fatty acid transport protein 4 n=1 Tax=Halyomorpha halys TaxID=286706 RepID=UPI0006D50A01|nr:long-chain fatty acid transport protein 4 [Halyomorpha halys]